MWLDRLGDIDDNLVFFIFCGVAAVLVAIGIVSIILPCCMPTMKGASPGGTMDFYIVIGGRFLAFTVLIRGIDVTWTNRTVITAFCQFYPAALLIGLTMFMGGLFIKTVSIYTHRWYRKPSAASDEWKPNLGMWALLLVIGIVSVIWCVLFTPNLAEVTGNHYLCYGDNQFEWKVATSAWHGLLLLVACIMMPLQCKASRKTPCRSESNALGLVIVNTLLVVVAGICQYYLYDATPTVRYAISGGLLLWAILFCDITLLAGKASMARRHTKAAEDSVAEEDERYDVIKEDGISVGRF